MKALFFRPFGRAKRRLLTGGYFVQNPLVYVFLRCADIYYGLYQASSPKVEIPARPKILVSNLAHLGDVVNATPVLAILKHTFPGAKIGFLAGSWAQALLKGHPLIEWYHYFDDWRLNRKPIGRWAKWKQHRQSFNTALRQIKGVDYDIAIDLYFYFPNAIYLFWKAGIPFRLGYTSGGSGPLLTHALVWEEKNQHVGEYHTDLIGILNRDGDPLPRPMANLPGINESAVEESLRILKQHGIQGEYVVCHPGTGSPMREWPLKNWLALVQRLTQDGWSLVFTGTGARESENIEEIILSSVLCYNLSNKLSWNGYLATIRNARLVMSVESLAGHLAAALSKPGVSIYTGIQNPALWKPSGPLSHTLIHPVPCAPCHRSGGCEGMECVRGVEVETVYRTIMGVLNGKDSGAPPDTRIVQPER